MSAQGDTASPRRRTLPLAAIAPLAPLAVVAVLASRPIRDNSFLWHIRAGSLQQDAQSVLSADPFSFTAFAQEWRTQSWLAELLYASLETTFGGLAWANWMTFIVAACTLGLVGLAVWRSLPSPFGVGLVLAVVVWLMGPFVQPRPVIFSFFLLALLVVVLVRRDELVWVVIPILWLWAGVHGSWILGGLLVALEWIRTGDRRLFFAGGIGGIATLATAHGIGTWAIVLSFLESREMLGRMQEWAPPQLMNYTQAPYLLVLAGLAIALAMRRITLRDLVVIIPFAILGLTSRRAVVPATIVLAPWAALALSSIRFPRSRISARAGLVLIGAVGALALLPMAVAPLGVLNTDRFPAPALVALLEDRRAFHGDAEGGYLIYAEWPERRVYIDDRAELYGIGLFDEYQATIDGAFERTFERWGIDAVLARQDWDLVPALTASGWRTLGEDNAHVVMVPGP